MVSYVSLVVAADQKILLKPKVRLLFTGLAGWGNRNARHTTFGEMRVYMKNPASRSGLSFAEVCTIIPLYLMLGT